VSIARAAAGTRKQRTETATGFKRKSGWAAVGAPSAPDTEIAVLRAGGGLGLTAEAHTRSERPTGEEKKNSESRVRGVFQRDDAPGIGAAQMPSGRVPRGAVPVQLPVVASTAHGILLLMQPQQDTINRWSDAAPFWEKHREIIRHMFAPVTNALVEDALIGSGDSVLDIATGPGEPALSIASLVGPEGKVFGIDPVLEMVDAARREGDRLRVRNAQFEIGPADHLPFPADTFDAVVSRFGVMFFASPVDAVREMLRVLKPGGRLAFAVWHLAEQNPFFYTLSRVIDRYVNSPPPAPDALDAFRFARPGLLRDVVGEAGTLVPSERMLQFTIEVPVSAEDFWTLRFEMSETLREKVSKLSMEQLAEVKRQALEAFREYSRDHGMSFPAEVLIVSASKSRLA
jgi:ubiquinone/menaquinone biosynthesis C-methylase UbiE